MHLNDTNDEHLIFPSFVFGIAKKYSDNLSLLLKLKNYLKTDFWSIKSEASQVCHHVTR